MIRIISVVSIALSISCSASHGGDGDASDVARDDAGPPPVTRDGGSTLDGAPPSGTDADVPAPPADAVVCGAAVCDPGQACCSLTLECFDPADAAACALPPESAGDPDACASNRDCEDGELCEHTDIFGEYEPAPACGGAVGHCVMERDPDLCGGFGAGVCGCDGRTYVDPCEASRAGVRVSWQRPCGTSPHHDSSFGCDPDDPICDPGWTCDAASAQCREDDPSIACGIDEQCAPDQFCCGVVGLCMGDERRDACFVPPPGEFFPCLEDADCAVLEPEAFGDTAPLHHYCSRPACGGQGGCRTKARDCGGALDPVCGCDGVSYANECWASEAGVSVASEGECP